jgi:glycosyltransferase involved in cell wall biosynthesis
MVVLEAMTCGLPVVASDIPPLREVSEGVAILLPLGEWDRWVEEIDKLLTNEDLRKEMGLEGVEKAKPHTWKEKALEFESYIIKAAQSKGKL